MRLVELKPAQGVVVDLKEAKPLGGVLGGGLPHPQVAVGEALLSVGQIRQGSGQSGVYPDCPCGPGRGADFP